MVWVQLVIYVVVTLLSDALKPKTRTEDLRPSKLGDFRFPTTTEDRVVPLLWGTCKLEGPNVVWYGDFHKTPVHGPGVDPGIFQSTVRSIIAYKYSVGIQFGICRGGSDQAQLLRIWNGDDVVYDEAASSLVLNADIDLPKLYGGLELGQGGLVGQFSFYGGSETQAVNTYLAQYQQEGGDTPAYRGNAYMVWQGGYLGTTSNPRPWSFECRRIPTGLGASNSVVNGQDANPAHVIYELLTNTEWGLGQSSLDIDTTNFADVAATLATEGNGFSLFLDSPQQAETLLDELQRQIDGTVFLNQTTGKWEIKLVRDDYVIGDMPHVTDSNCLEIRDFSRMAWDDTTNDIKVRYASRAKEYTETFAQAQDPANQAIQGTTVTGTFDYPGVKDDDLASNIASRQLRALARPLARATLVVDRTFWDVTVGSVLRWSTDAITGISEMPVRVTQVDLGSLDAGRITLSVVEDVFKFLQPSFGNPFISGWVPTGDTLVAIPANEQTVIEAPRAFLVRDPALIPGDPILDKIWCGAQAQQDEMKLQVRERHALGTPSGAYASAGLVFGTYVMGTLNDPLPADDLSALVEVEMDGLALDITDIFIPVSLSLIGQQLLHLIRIDDEFMLVEYTQNADLITAELVNVHRGVLDSAVLPHAAGARVHFLGVAGALTDTVFTPGHTVDVKLVPESMQFTLAEASATVIQFTMANRLRRPYPPVDLTLNGAIFPTGTVSLDVAFAAGEDGKGVNFDYTRRDYRNTDELVALAETGLPGDFPAANTTEYEVEVYNDPSGSPTLLFTIAFGTAQKDFDISRTTILRYMNGVIPTELRFLVTARHTHEAVVYEARVPAYHDADTASAQLAGKVNLTTLDESETSASFVAGATGTWTFRIATDLLTTGALEVQLNGSGWTSVIASGGGTSGTLSITSGDTVEVRHTQGGPNTQETLITVENPSATLIAYGILVA